MCIRDSINFVRLVDIVGDGRTTDSNGNPIFDAFSPNNATGGFDLDAVGVLNAVPEPTTAALLSLAAEPAASPPRLTPLLPRRASARRGDYLWLFAPFHPAPSHSLSCWW